MDQAIEKGPGGDNHSFGIKGLAQVCLDTNDPTPLHEDLFNGGLLDKEILLIFNRLFHSQAILLPVRLGSRGPNCGPSPFVQLTKLYPGFVGRFGHLPAESVNLFYQVTFRQPADGRIA
jgi:hypothetical protein